LRVIDLGNIAGLHAHNHELHANCPRCGRWSTLPLAEWVNQGKGLLRLPINVRCRECGEPGRLQVRPPTPTRGPGGWMEPH
jgi:ribosomal protein L37E